MVCNEIILGGNSILKIYHKDFNTVSARKVLHNRKIGRCNLEFRQYQASSEELDSISGFTYKREGLLPPNVCPNPYGDTVCATMTHYVFDEKPYKIFNTKEKIYSLKLPIQDFIEVAEFMNNSAGGNGGAIYSGGVVDLYAVTFTNNSAKGSGGAIYSLGEIFLQSDLDYECYFEQNHADVNGGAICSNNSQVILYALESSIEFTNNSADGDGGAIYSTSGLDLRGDYGEFCFTTNSNYEW